MFEAIGGSIAGVLALTCILMVLTFPAWLAGQIAARQTRALPVPFFYRPKILRWVSWYFTGIVGLTAVVLALRPVGTFDTPARLVFVGIALLSYAGTAIAAFYIAWTASAKRRARKSQRDVSDPVPLVQSSVVGSPQKLPGGGDDPSMYAPATPQADDAGQPEEPGTDEYPEARPAN